MTRPIPMTGNASLSRCRGALKIPEDSARMEAAGRGERKAWSRPGSVVTKTKRLVSRSQTNARCGISPSSPALCGCQIARTPSTPDQDGICRSGVVAEKPHPARTVSELSVDEPCPVSEINDRPFRVLDHAGSKAAEQPRWHHIALAKSALRNTDGNR